ncbi:MAG: hypothetical protein CVV51_08775 [Spirochaetae bacterium HGW-Spirochaetae-7]|nr:MAG: hypothetical protein CVV51_08775 [Spirochaetae bacterium HGW-Spirochaetae-7]
MIYADIIAKLDPGHRATIDHLLLHDDVLSMDGFRHHDRTALTHSLAVSTNAYRWARRLGFDAESTARGALLHDFFLYDRRDGLKHRHPTRHARVALGNAKARFILNPVESDIILTHMWPVGGPFYSYRESILVSLVDKIVSTKEVLILLGRNVTRWTSIHFSRLADSPA